MNPSHQLPVSPSKRQTSKKWILHGACFRLRRGWADLRTAVVALVRNAIPEELGRFNSFHDVRGISIFDHENSVQHILAQSQVDFTMGGQKRPLIVLVEQFRIIRFPLFSFLSCPPQSPKPAGRFSLRSCDCARRVQPPRNAGMSTNVIG